LREVRKPYGNLVAKTRNVSYWGSRRKFETEVKAIYTTFADFEIGYFTLTESSGNLDS
jgi:hypothetical protein